MNLVLVASLAAAGLVAGRGQRAVIVRYAVPAGELPLRHCPACGQQLLSARQVALAARLNDGLPAAAQKRLPS